MRRKDPILPLISPGLADRLPKSRKIQGLIFEWSGVRRGRQTRQRPMPRELLAVLRESVWALLLPLLIFGGNYSGVFTANEAAVAAFSYVFIVEISIHGDMQKIVVSLATI